jgi:hypothetical protein
MAVHIGARVGASAEADEILVSRTVADLVVGSGFRFTDRGEHELKGIAGRWRLFAVGDPADRPVQPPGSGSTEREMRLSVGDGQIEVLPGTIEVKLAPFLGGG